MDMIDLNPQNQPDAWWQHLIIFAVAGVIGYIIGYRTSGDTAAELEEELDGLDSELGDCRSTNATLTAKKAQAHEPLAQKEGTVQSPVSEVSGFKSDMEGKEAGGSGVADLGGSGTVDTGVGSAAGLGVTATPLATPEAKAVPAKPDDLKKVEGIGPKIQELLNKQGIMTFRQLSETPADTLVEILRDAGTRFQMHDPGTWPKQAELAADGKWDELKAWQSELDKGKVS